MKYCSNICFITALLFLCLSAFCSCEKSSDDIKTDQEVEKQWKKEIQALNEKYSVLAGVDFSNSASKKMTQRCMEVDGWEVAYWDALGAAQGARVGAIAGGVGAIAGGAAGSALLSLTSFFVQKSENENPNNPEDTTANAIAFWMDDFGPEETTTNTIIDSRDPICNWNDISSPFNSNIGVESGILHNFIVTQVLTNPSYNDFCRTNPSSVMTAIQSVISDYNMFNCNIEYICDNVLNSFYREHWLDSINIGLWLSEIEERFVCLEDFYEIAFNLDSALFYEYANAYTTIIDNAWRDGYLLEEEAMLINQSISVGCYSHMLWRKYIEVPTSTNLRMAFDMNNNEIIYCNKERLDVLIQTNNVQYFGIPHFVRNRIAEVYFYGTAGENFVLPNVENIYIAPNTEYIIHGEVGYIEDYENYSLCPGFYPVSTFMLANDVRCIKSYDYNTTIDY